MTDRNDTGDDDPVDVVDLSEATGSTGEVKTVKVLGTYAMIDDGETDWKMIVIGASDPKASVIHGDPSVILFWFYSVFEGVQELRIVRFRRCREASTGEIAGGFHFLA